jgi:hypothetical protein
MKLQDIAIARSGDKGNLATLSVIARDPAHYPLLEQRLTAEHVRQHFEGIVQGAVQRYTLPQLGALHFVMHDALGGGVTRSLALDAHGKTLSAALLDIGLDSGLDSRPDAARD